ncbi:Cocaine esterase [Fusarium oxysporum f. sp. rapae]|uniref:Cocaine esterase n=1 Tax=Fusarium oxysporum f. sp. rapae TaxID=485398 RepID=A0A8J5NR79_FUSOX|nr:Cocaine esterase [Fusarium oxysporum f. sp. rapae]
MIPTTHPPVKPQKIQELFPDAIISKITPAHEHPRYNYEGFNPGRRVLEAGHVRYPGRRPFGVRTIYERDQAIIVRDGARLYADIFRPQSSDTQPVPCILPWSPYGKTGTGPQNYDFMAPYRAGIALDRTSGYEKFEAPDPAEWAERGYAVLNIDARGAGHSEGVIARWGIQDAEDIYDIIDWLSKQHWCNGSVVMAGNSWLAISQINFASRMHHPALKAIAPWEGYTDLYRHYVARGGRPHIPGFHRMISNGLAGPEGVENVVAMLKKHMLYDDYWEAKRIPVENIYNIPMYVVASYSSMLHAYGSFQTFRQAKTEKKWLRVHPYQEWYDMYRPSVSDELQQFFDFYCKPDIVKDTNWESSTPRVRLSLLGFEADESSATTVIERPEQSYPLTRQRLRTLYLAGTTGKLVDLKPGQESIKSYEGKSLTDRLTFTATFDVATELAGYPKAVLHISCPDHDDFDVVVQIRKIDNKGRQLSHLNYPCPVAIDEVPDVNTAKTLGPQGFLRASHSVSLNGDGGPVVSEDLSRETDVLYSHRVRQPISPGTIVRLEIPIWPIGMVFAAGEGIALNVSGHDMCLPETDLCRLTEPEDDNVGRHYVHTGGKYDSHLIIPVIMG